MSRSVEAITIIKESKSPTGEVRRTDIASVDFSNEVHQLGEKKVLTIEVTGFDSQQRQKCIIGGNVIPTVQTPGRPGGRTEIPNARRVVIVPRHKETVSQEMGDEGRLLFFFKRKPDEQRTLAAD